MVVAFRLSGTLVYLLVEVLPSEILVQRAFKLWVWEIQIPQSELLGLVVKKSPSVYFWFLD